MTVEIVGREEELRSLRAFFGRTSGGPAVLILECEAGIGKSTLWRAAVEEASAQSTRVLSRLRLKPSAGSPSQVSEIS
jgi:predicted ATPase